MIIKIENLRLRTIVGIYEWEKKDRQDVVINVELEFDGTTASGSDNIDDTVDYKSITKKIIKFVESNSFNLLERIAGGIADITLESERVKRSVVKVDKPGALRFADSVSVTETKDRI